MENIPICPICKEPIYEVHFADDVKRWRCMDCNLVYSSVEYRLGKYGVLEKR